MQGKKAVVPTESPRLRARAQTQAHGLSPAGLGHARGDEEAERLDLAKHLNLDSDAQAELARAHTFDFDIFKLREYTKDNELVAATSYVSFPPSINRADPGQRRSVFRTPTRSEEVPHVHV